MQFDWDEANVAHIARHKVAAREAEQVICNEPLDLANQDYQGEERMVHLGETASGRVLVVVTTMREESVRVVTAFPPDRKLRSFYLREKAKSYGTAKKDGGE